MSNAVERDTRSSRIKHFATPKKDAPSAKEIARACALNIYCKPIIADQQQPNGGKKKRGKDIDLGFKTGLNLSDPLDLSLPENAGTIRSDRAENHVPLGLL